jgi:hypothetical protein
MTGLTINDAKLTLKSVIVSGLSKNAHLTGMRAGRQTDILIKDVIDELLNPQTIWAVRMLVCKNTKR